MKITLESTTKIVEVKPHFDAEPMMCRVWEGLSEAGIRVVVLVARVAVAGGQDTTQFEAELLETRPPSADAQAAFPLRMIL